MSVRGRTLHDMKAIWVLAVAAGLVLAPVAAHADLPPNTWDEPGGNYLDCTAGVWWVDVAHYTAEQTEPGVYAEPTVVYSTEVLAPAGADCPREPDLSAPVEVVAPATPVAPAPVPAASVVVWKLGIYG